MPRTRTTEKHGAGPADRGSNCTVVLRTRREGSRFDRAGGERPCRKGRTERSVGPRRRPQRGSPRKSVVGNGRDRWASNATFPYADAAVCLTHRHGEGPPDPHCGARRVRLPDAVPPGTPPGIETIWVRSVPAWSRQAGTARGRPCRSRPDASFGDAPPSSSSTVPPRPASSTSGSGVRGPSSTDPGRSKRPRPCSAPRVGRTARRPGGAPTAGRPPGNRAHGRMSLVVMAFALSVSRWPARPSGRSRNGRSSRGGLEARCREGTAGRVRRPWRTRVGRTAP